MYYHWTHPVIVLFLYLGVLGSVLSASVGQSYHWHCIDPFLYECVWWVEVSTCCSWTNRPCCWNLCI